MYTMSYKIKLSVLNVLAISMVLVGCLAFNNKQLTSQLEGINALVHEDERGLIITIPTVYFDFDSSNLKVAAREKIVKIADILNQDNFNNRLIVVEGYTDNIGDFNYNLALSDERAQAVLKELVFSNVAYKRISSVGKSETSPVSDNSTFEGRQLNRRVTIIVFNRRY